jgi:hypothetical protein
MEMKKKGVNILVMVVNGILTTLQFAFLPPAARRALKQVFHHTHASLLELTTHPCTQDIAPSHPPPVRVHPPRPMLHLAVQDAD